MSSVAAPPLHYLQRWLCSVVLCVGLRGGGSGAERSQAGDRNVQMLVLIRFEPSRASRFGRFSNNIQCCE